MFIFFIHKKNKIIINSYIMLSKYLLKIHRLYKQGPHMKQCSKECNYSLLLSTDLNKYKQFKLSSREDR